MGGFVCILGPCGFLQQTLLWGWEFFPLPQATQVFSLRGFEALFPQAVTLGCLVYLTPQLFFLVYLHTNVGPSCPPVAGLPWILSIQLPVSAPPTGLDECFFFNSLVVGLPYSSIFWQFWLFCFVLFLDLLLSFFWLCKDAQCVYLCFHLCQKSQFFPYLNWRVFTEWSLKDILGQLGLNKVLRLVQFYSADWVSFSCLTFCSRESVRVLYVFPATTLLPSSPTWTLQLTPTGLPAFTLIPRNHSPYIIQTELVNV